MTKITISLVQMHIEPGKFSNNVAKAHHGILEAGEHGSNLVLLPELWSTGYDLKNSAHHAAQNTEFEAEIAAWCKRYNMWIGGSVLKKNPAGVQNMFQLHDPSGKIVSQYPKIHLFGLMNEDRYLKAGDRPVFARPPWGKTGLSICYDLRFPELFRVYAISGCVLVLLSAEWPLRRISHWQTLLKARAIENQIFFAAANCVGAGGDETFGGYSVVINPWGEICVEAGNNTEEIVTTRIDLKDVQRVQTTIPVLTDRCPKAYYFNPEAETSLD